MMTTCQWMSSGTWLAGKDPSRLIAMVDTLGMPTIFLTHSAADLQWPELARLICPDDPDSSSSRSKALMENPAIADWFFYHRINKFIDVFYKGVLQAYNSDYWMRFEWQHHGSPHVHGLAWLEDAPNVETSDEPADQINDPGSSQDGDRPPTAACKQELLEYVNRTITTINPAVLPDGSNVADAPLPKTNPHICNKPYSDVTDYNQDLADLIATCQRHTRC